MESLPLKQAHQIIDGALARARAENFKPMGIVVVDDGGNLKASHAHTRCQSSQAQYRSTQA